MSLTAASGADTPVLAFKFEFHSRFQETQRSGLQEAFDILSFSQ